MRRCGVLSLQFPYVFFRTFFSAVTNWTRVVRELLGSKYDSALSSKDEGLLKNAEVVIWTIAGLTADLSDSLGSEPCL